MGVVVSARGDDVPPHHERNGDVPGRLSEVQLPESLEWGTSYDFQGNGYLLIDRGGDTIGDVMEIRNGWKNEQPRFDEAPRNAAITESRWSVVLVTSADVLFKVSVQEATVDRELVAAVGQEELLHWLSLASGLANIGSEPVSLPTDEAEVAADKPPLVAGFRTASAVPDVVNCQPGDATPPPPKRGGAVNDSTSARTPSEALSEFLAARGTPNSPIPATLAQRGYTEIALPEGTIAYAYQPRHDVFAYATVIHVVPSEQGWKVVSWAASGC